MTSPNSQRPPDELEPLPILEPRPDQSGVPTEEWEKERSASSGHPAWWLWGVAGIVVALLGWSIVRTSTKPAASIASDLEELYQSSKASRSPVPTRHEAESLIAAYMEADTVEARLTTVRDSERVRPMLRAYPLVPQKFDSLQLLARRHQGSLDYHIAQALTSSGDEESFVLLHSPQDGWRIDWETSVAYNPYSWVSMIEAPPAEATDLRVRAASGSYYNYQFGNARDFLCVELREPNGEGVIYGYIDRHTEQSKPLMDLLDSGKETPLMLRVQFPKEGKAEAQCLILAFLQQGWLRHH